MIMKRDSDLCLIKEDFTSSKIVAILGPRQCGKTTLAHEYFSLHKGHALQYIIDLKLPKLTVIYPGTHPIRLMPILIVLD